MLIKRFNRAIKYNNYKHTCFYLQRSEIYKAEIDRIEGKDRQYYNDS